MSEQTLADIVKVDKEFIETRKIDVDFVPRFTMVLTCNSLPTIKSCDKAMVTQEMRKKWGREARINI